MRCVRGGKGGALQVSWVFSDICCIKWSNFVQDACHRLSVKCSFINIVVSSFIWREFSSKNNILACSREWWFLVLYCFIKSDSCLWMVLGGLIRFWLVFLNYVYGCGFRMCLSGGFRRSAILSRSVVIQFGLGMCISWWSHVSNFLVAGLLW